MAKNSDVLSIIIPAHNEEGAIAETIQQSIKASEDMLLRTSLRNAEIIVVNDGSSDNTYNIARSFTVSGKISVISRQGKRNYGEAILEGVRRAQGRYLAFLDADGTYDPQHLISLFNSMQLHEADIVVGSRVGPGIKMPCIRKIGNCIGAFLVNGISGKNIPDVTSGMLIIKREVFNSMLPLPKGFDFTLEIIMKGVTRPDLKIVEESVPYRKRIGKSKLNPFVDGYRLLRTILRFYSPA